MIQSNPSSSSINAIPSSQQHIHPWSFQAERKEDGGADRVRLDSKMLAHSILVFCMYFLLSLQAPNSAELKWDEVIGAAVCEDVLAQHAKKM
jgi:hypothetical protein